MLTTPALPRPLVEEEGPLTPEEKHKQTVFAVCVAVCFLMVLVLSIGHAAFSHIMERRRYAPYQKIYSEAPIFFI